MHSLNSNQSHNDSCQQLADKILDVIPKTMRDLRTKTYSHSGLKLPLPQFRVLGNVWNESKTNKQLAEEIGLSISAMSRVISNLESNGLIEKLENKEDKRYANISITKTGKRYFNKIRLHTSKLISERINQLSDKEKMELYKGLSIIEELFKCQN
ncbi:MAG: MarR family winged helix-turn-helix transcriptional regulator [Bdellovibrio sp.]